MNKLIIVLLFLSGILMSGCRTTRGSYYPAYNPPLQADEASRQKYFDRASQWQEQQRNRDRIINNEKNYPQPWWRWWLNRFMP
ncbi:MAG TPA: hypothetical protein PKN36_05375 [bacterium]|nr:hypothetical protein [bacterium]